MPVIFFVAFFLLFWYLGYSFFTGLGLFAIAFYINYKWTLYLSSINREMLKVKDERMQKTSEAINNVKTLKLYSWQKKFYELISKRRDNEIRLIRKIGVSIAWL